MPVRMPHKSFCNKCGFVWSRGKGCVQCKIERAAMRGVPKPKKEKAAKPAIRKVDKRRKKQRDAIRSKTIWELAELVMALDSVLEVNDFGRVTLYEDRVEEAGQVKARVPEVMKNVQRAYELSKRYPTKTLRRIRKTFPLQLTAYTDRQ